MRALASTIIAPLCACRCLAPRCGLLRAALYTLSAAVFQAIADRSSSVVPACQAWQATACSGTDVPLFVYHGLRKAVMRVLGIPLELVHLFSCERSPAKQAFLRTMYEDMLTLFSDAIQIGMPVAHDQISQKMQPVPEDVHSLFVG